MKGSTPNNKRIRGESSRAIRAYHDYLALGPGRSLAKLLQIYTEPGAEAPPTKRLKTLAEWSTGFDWQARAAAYDKIIQEQRADEAQGAAKSNLIAVLSSTYDALIEANREIIRRLREAPQVYSSRDLVRLTRGLSAQLEGQLRRQFILSTQGKAKLRFFVLKRDGFRCRYCGRNPSEDGVRLQVDHIMPRSKGGSDHPNNLITACFDCNIGKRDEALEPELERFVREVLKKDPPDSPPGG